MAHDMELIKQDSCIGRVDLSGITKRLPHVHHCEPHTLAALLPEKGVKLLEACLGAVFTAEPDRTLTDEIADHDAIDMAFADRELIDADHLRGRHGRALELRAHILLLQLLDRMPVELELLGHRLDGRTCTAPPYVPGKPLGIQRIVGNPIQLFTFHLAALSTGHASDLELQIHPCVAAGQIPYPARAAVVPTAMCRGAHSAPCFFERRSRVTMRAFGSPKIPRTVALGRKPGNVYESVSRRRRLRDLAMGLSCQKCWTLRPARNSVIARLVA